MTEVDVNAAIAEDVGFGCEVLIDGVDAVQRGVRHLWDLRRKGQTVGEGGKEEEEEREERALALFVSIL